MHGAQNALFDVGTDIVSGNAGSIKRTARKSLFAESFLGLSIVAMFAFMASWAILLSTVMGFEDQGVYGNVTASQDRMQRAVSAQVLGVADTASTSTISLVEGFDTANQIATKYFVKEGSVLVLTGNFENDGNVVLFDNTTAAPESQNKTQIKVRVPSSFYGTHSVKVKNSRGVSAGKTVLFVNKGGIVPAEADKSGAIIAGVQGVSKKGVYTNAVVPQGGSLVIYGASLENVSEVVVYSMKTENVEAARIKPWVSTNQLNAALPDGLDGDYKVRVNRSNFGYFTVGDPTLSVPTTATGPVAQIIISKPAPGEQLQSGSEIAINFKDANANVGDVYKLYLAKIDSPALNYSIVGQIGQLTNTVPFTSQGGVLSFVWKVGDYAAASGRGIAQAGSNYIIAVYKGNASYNSGAFSITSPITPPRPTTSCTTTAPVNSFVGCYYDNKDFTSYKLSRVEPASNATVYKLNLDWGFGAPASGVGAETFSVKWKGSFQFEPGYYKFLTSTDDGVIVKLVSGNDAQTVVSRNFDQGESEVYQPRIKVEGTKEVQIDYYENLGKAAARVGWYKVHRLNADREKYDFDNNERLDFADVNVLSAAWKNGTLCPRLSPSGVNYCDLNNRGGFDIDDVTWFASYLVKKFDVNADGKLDRNDYDKLVNVIGGRDSCSIGVSCDVSEDDKLDLVDGVYEGLVIDSYQKYAATTDYTATLTIEPNSNSAPSIEAGKLYTGYKVWYDPDGALGVRNREDKTLDATWGTHDASIAIVPKRSDNPSLQTKGTVMGIKAGRTGVTATYNGLGATSGIVVTENLTNKPGVTFDITPSNTTSVSPITLSWNVTNATKIEISPSVCGTTAGLTACPAIGNRTMVIGTTGTYTFKLTATNAAGVVEKTASVTLTAPVVSGCDASIQDQFCASYYDDTNSGALYSGPGGSAVHWKNLVASRVENYPVAYNVGSNSIPQVTGIKNDQFSAYWVGNFKFEAQQYKFDVTSDDGMKVLIDGQPIYNSMVDQGAKTIPVNYTFTSAGYHKVEMYYYENQGLAWAQVNWTLVPTTTGGEFNFITPYVNGLPRGVVGSPYTGFIEFSYTGKNKLNSVFSSLPAGLQTGNGLENAGIDPYANGGKSTITLSGVPTQPGTYKLYLVIRDPACVNLLCSSGIAGEFTLVIDPAPTVTPAKSISNVKIVPADDPNGLLSIVNGVVVLTKGKSYKVTWQGVGVEKYMVQVFYYDYSSNEFRGLDSLVPYSTGTRSTSITYAPSSVLAKAHLQVCEWAQTTCSAGSPDVFANSIDFKIE